MQEADRKAVWGGIVVLAVIAIELAWVLFIGPANHNPTQCPQGASDCNTPWWNSAAFWTAFFTFALTGSTILLWWQTRRLAQGAEAQSTDIKAQVEVVRDDFVSTHRPWIDFYARIGPKGIWFDPAGMRINMTFTCNNTGSTPGVGVSINATAFLRGPGNDELDILQRACSEMGPPQNVPQPFITGTTIFPGGRWTFEKTFLIPQKLLNAVVADKRGIFPCVVGCVDYAFSFGPLEPHQTRFSFNLGNLDPAQKAAIRPFIIADGAKAAGQILIMRSSLMQAFAVS